MILRNTLIYLFIVTLFSCEINSKQDYNTIKISREKYANQLYGFWLGQSIANWTGLITEMDKVGNIGEIKTGNFYTRNDWGKKDQRSIWEDESIDKSNIKIDFVFKDIGEFWGADDDTDIEYMYQYLLNFYETSILSPSQIRAGWLKHIKKEEENFLWVSNQRAFDLMIEGIFPPETSNPSLNEHFEMIDAQLTTEIFGLFSPTRPELSMKMAELPISTTARNEAKEIAEFYIRMHSLASIPIYENDTKEKIFWLAEKSRAALNDLQYPAKMYDYVKELYDSNIKWESARDSIYNRYQVEQQDGYNMTSRELYCNGCYAAGINFASSLISLFFGEGNIKETIKIGTLSGWDSDNPTSTWGGLIGFMIGKSGVEEAFDRDFSNKFNIHRTRQNFPNNGIDTFENMANEGIRIIDRVIKNELNGTFDRENNLWLVPVNNLTYYNK